MTRILEIVGTKVKIEVGDCTGCPCYGMEEGCQIGDEPCPENCPLPEKEPLLVFNVYRITEEDIKRLDELREKCHGGRSFSFDDID